MATPTFSIVCPHSCYSSSLAREALPAKPWPWWRLALRVEREPFCRLASGGGRGGSVSEPSPVPSADLASYAALLRECGRAKLLSQGRRLHAHLVRANLHRRNPFLSNLLIQMYADCGALDEGRRVFDSMPRRNLFSWTLLIRAYSRHGHPSEALRLFHSMLRLCHIPPDRVAFVSILSVISTPDHLPDAVHIHSLLSRSGIPVDHVLATALITAYGKCGSLPDARRVFDSVAPSRKHIALWNALIAAHVRQGERAQALGLFCRMQLECLSPDKITFLCILEAYSCESCTAIAEAKLIHSCILRYGFESDCALATALINMYSKCGSLMDARRVFDQTPERDVVLWTAIIMAYTQHEYGEEALDLFREMELQGFAPDKVAFVGALDACAASTTLSKGKAMHRRIMSYGFDSDIIVGNALVNMYAKCGSLRDAQKVFNNMATRNTVSWTAMITAHSKGAQAEQALELFEKMQQEGVTPNKVTFVALFSACSHSGMVDEGCRYFVSMSRDFGIIPMEEHYDGIIDILLRAGYLDEGEDLILNMPLQATWSSWMSLLGACRMHSDVERGQRVAKNAIELHPDNSLPYVLLAQIYSAVGMWDDATRMMNLMEEKGFKNSLTAA